MNIRLLCYFQCLGFKKKYFHNVNIIITWKFYPDIVQGIPKTNIISVHFVPVFFTHLVFNKVVFVSLSATLNIILDH